jgi:uncharacterized membrane protein YbhN (UPF0104 family)
VSDDVVPEARSRAWRSWRLVRPLVLLVLALFVARVIAGIVGAIDWPAVWGAIGLVPLTAAALLALLLLLRQALNAIPLARFVPGLSLPQSMQNDLAAFLVGTVAPPPADVVLRVSMFRSWDIDPVEGMAGVTLNMLTFYAVRFVAPAFGLAFLAFHEVDSGQVWAAAASTAAALAILAGLVSLSRGDRLAAVIGRAAGSVAGRFRASVEPSSWSRAVVEFRAKVGDRVSSGVGPSLVALVAMLAAEAAMLLVAIRAVGLSSGALPFTLVVGSFLLAYPLTLFPLMGLGILDAAVVAALTSWAGSAYEAQIVGGLIVWRVTSLLAPYPLGLAALLSWRWSSRARVDAAAGQAPAKQASTGSSAGSG